jgi:glycosyltransferase involved in cell wall biosynthesis
MVRVALDVTPLLGARTGIGTFVHELVTGLAAIHPDPLRGEENGRDDRPIDLRTFAVTWRGRNAVDGSRHLRPMPARPLRAMWLRADHPTIECWTGPVDLVHGTNYVVPPSSGAVELVSVHDISFLRFPELCTSDTRQYTKLLHRALARGAHVHTDSRFVADEVMGYLGWPPDRVHVVALASTVVPEAAEAPDSNSDPHSNFETKVPELIRGRPFVLALGTVEPRKDHAALLQAFALIATSLPDLQLVIAGKDGWGIEPFQRALAALPPAFRSRVHRLGYVSSSLRFALLKSASVFAYPSIYEGFGLSPLEAMAFGIPVVATDAGSLPEVLGQAAEFVPVGDPAALADAIERVMTNQARRAFLQDAGRQRSALFTRDAMTTNFARLYSDLVDRGRQDHRFGAPSPLRFESPQGPSSDRQAGSEDR